MRSPTGVDNQWGGDWLAFVRRLRYYIAFVLLALWMPATLYCEMETARLLAECGSCHDEKTSDGIATDCDADGGGMIESGAFRLPSDILLLKTTDVMAWLLLAVFPPEIARSPLTPLDCTTAPAELTRTWQFVVRAAPPPRAPTFMA